MTPAEVLGGERFSMVPPAGLVAIPLGDDAGSTRRRGLLAGAVCTPTGTGRSEVAAALGRLAREAGVCGALVVGVLPVGAAVAAFTCRAVALPIPPQRAEVDRAELVRALLALLDREGSMCSAELVALPSGPSMRRLDQGRIASRQGGSGLDLTRIQYLLPSRNGRQLITINFMISGDAGHQAVQSIAEQVARSARWTSGDRDHG